MDFFFYLDKIFVNREVKRVDCNHHLSFRRIYDKMTLSISHRWRCLKSIFKISRFFIIIGEQLNKNKTRAFHPIFYPSKFNAKDSRFFRDLRV